jgi:hypothetical protein
MICKKWAHNILTLSGLDLSTSAARVTGIGWGKSGRILFYFADVGKDEKVACAGGWRGGGEVR